MRRADLPLDVQQSNPVIWPGLLFWPVKVDVCQQNEIRLILCDLTIFRNELLPLHTNCSSNKF